MSKIMKEWASFATDIALLAGDILRKGFGSQFVIGSKPGKQNLVTEYDRASENLLITAIKSQYPTHSIIAEESGSYIQQKSQATWIHEIPLFSINIGVAIHKEIVCGVVYQPMIRELFVAQKQQGAFLNGRLLSISSISQMNQALLATGFPYDVHKDPLHCIESFSEVLRTGTPIRRLGTEHQIFGYHNLLATNKHLHPIMINYLN